MYLSVILCFFGGGGSEDGYGIVMGILLVSAELTPSNIRYSLSPPSQDQSLPWEPDPMGTPWAALPADFLVGLATGSHPGETRWQRRKMGHLLAPPGLQLSDEASLLKHRGPRPVAPLLYSNTCWVPVMLFPHLTFCPRDGNPFPLLLDLGSFPLLQLCPLL